MNQNDYSKIGLTINQPKPVIHFQEKNHKLIEKAVELKMAKFSKDGSLVIKTGKHTGRSAGDKYVVKSPKTEKTVWWENSIKPMTAENFAALKNKVTNYLNNQENLFITERSVGAHPSHNLGLRVISPSPTHILFSNHLFREKMKDLSSSDFTILHAPHLVIDPKEFGTVSETVITTCFDTNTTIIIGTAYAGEIKKSMFCILNYLLPEKKILPMHSGANKSLAGDVSVFFGLSGTGKTSLSTDEGTLLIGDDEHGLSSDGVFNFEGGCYAKTYQLSEENEPGIYKATNRFGALCENVVLDENTGVIDFSSKAISENGRSSYPLEFVGGIEKSSRGGIPKHMFFLSADAFGILPPVSKLTKEQAMFYFVLGYTAKLAGTEIGVQSPSATFSCCFGAPFMLRHPEEYAQLLGEFLDKYEINVWLINTGWTGGPYGVGHRFPIKTTREIIRAIQADKLNNNAFESDPIFGLNIPLEVQGINKEVLWPQKSWNNASEYENKANELALSFHKQMKKFGSFYERNINGSPISGR